jgi:hypothetical protein
MPISIKTTQAQKNGVVAKVIKDGIISKSDRELLDAVGVSKDRQSNIRQTLYQPGQLTAKETAALVGKKTAAFTQAQRDSAIAAAISDGKFGDYDKPLLKNLGVNSTRIAREAFAKAIEDGKVSGSDLEKLNDSGGDKRVIQREHGIYLATQDGTLSAKEIAAMKEAGISQARIDAVIADIRVGRRVDSVVTGTLLNAALDTMPKGLTKAELQRLRDAGIAGDNVDPSDLEVEGAASRFLFDQRKRFEKLVETHEEWVENHTAHKDGTTLKEAKDRLDAIVTQIATHGPSKKLNARKDRALKAVAYLERHIEAGKGVKERYAQVSEAYDSYVRARISQNVRTTR